MKNDYKNLSKDQLYLISRAEFEKQKLITTPFVQKLFPNKNKASRVLSFLTKKGRLLKIEKGKAKVPGTQRGTGKRVAGRYKAMGRRNRRNIL